MLPVWALSPLGLPLRTWQAKPLHKRQSTIINMSPTAYRVLSLYGFKPSPPKEIYGGWRAPRDRPCSARPGDRAGAKGPRT